MSIQQAIQALNGITPQNVRNLPQLVFTMAYRDALVEHGIPKEIASTVASRVPTTFSSSITDVQLRDLAYAYARVMAAIYNTFFDAGFSSSDFIDFSARSTIDL
jgi:hypothetical protein